MGIIIPYLAAIGYKTDYIFLAPVFFCDKL